MTAFAFLVAMAAFAALALSMDRHARDLLGKRPARRHSLGLRLAGWSGLLIAYIAIIAGWGAALGSVLYLGLLSAAAGITLLAISHLTVRAQRR